jgi:hypothetical protein
MARDSYSTRGGSKEESFRHGNAPKGFILRNSALWTALDGTNHMFPVIANLMLLFFEGKLSNVDINTQFMDGQMDSLWTRKPRICD